MTVEEKRARLAGGLGGASRSAQSEGGGSIEGGSAAASAAEASAERPSPRDVPREPAASRKAIVVRAGLCVAVCVAAMALIIAAALFMRG